MPRGISYTYAHGEVEEAKVGAAVQQGAQPRVRHTLAALQAKHTHARKVGKANV